MKSVSKVLAFLKETRFSFQLALALFLFISLSSGMASMPLSRVLAAKKSEVLPKKSSEKKNTKDSEKAKDNTHSTKADTEKPSLQQVHFNPTTPTYD